MNKEEKIAGLIGDINDAFKALEASLNAKVEAEKWIASDRARLNKLENELKAIGYSICQCFDCREARERGEIEGYENVHTEISILHCTQCGNEIHKGKEFEFADSSFCSEKCIEQYADDASKGYDESDNYRDINNLN